MIERIVSQDHKNRGYGLSLALIAAVVAVVLPLMVACGTPGSDRVTSIDATGQVEGFVYFDVNGNREPDADDEPMADVVLALVLAGTSDTVRTTTSDQIGLFVFQDVLVGSYGIVVDTNTIGDSTIVAGVDPSDVSVTPDDSLGVSVSVSFPIVSTAEARTMTAGSKVFIDGIALNPENVYGDATVHVSDTSGSLRAIRSGAGLVIIGDSVRFRGTMSTNNGQPVVDLDRAAPLVISFAEVPIPDTVTTAEAADADSGGTTLDAALARVDSSRITDTVTVNNDVVATVSDASGPLEVVFDEDIGFNLGLFLLPGADLKVTGLLIPDGSGKWQLKPRSDSDVEVIAPVIPISAARATSVGEIVFVDGVVLNNQQTFGDNTVHVSDTSAAIRAVGVTVSVSVRDSIRLIGQIAMRDGQPVCENPTIFLLGNTFEPQPTDVTTGEIPSAVGATMDAELVRITGVPITASAVVGGDFHVTVNDGTGVATVVIDQDLPGYAGPPPFDFSTWVPGANLNATGLLVVTGGGVWVLKPRSITGPLPDANVP